MIYWPGLALLLSLYVAFGVTLANATAPPAKTSDSPVSPPVAEAKDGIPAGHKLLYGLARAKAAKELAKKEGISRAAAREKIDDAIDDAALHALVQASGAVVVKAQPSGGKLGDFVDWLIAHQDQILAIVKIIMALFNVHANVETSAHDWCGLLFATAA